MQKLIPSLATFSVKVAELMRFVSFINSFRRKERLIWYKGNNNRELNGEHCYQLSMVAWYLRERHLPHLDLTKVILYAKVHDLPEVYAQDTPAFIDKSGKYGTTVKRETKKSREAKALKRIEQEWEHYFPSMLEHLRAYEAQEDEESRFINALDKFLSELNILEDDGRTDKELQITMEEKIAYKRPRIAAHPFVLSFYDEFLRFCEQRPDLFFVPKVPAQ